MSSLHVNQHAQQQVLWTYFVKVIIAGCMCENLALSVDTLCSIIVFTSALVPMGTLEYKYFRVLIC